MDELTNARRAAILARVKAILAPLPDWQIAAAFGANDVDVWITADGDSLRRYAYLLFRKNAYAGRSVFVYPGSLVLRATLRMLELAQIAL